MDALGEWTYAVLFVGACVLAVPARTSAETVDYSRDIRPILSDYC